MTVDADVLRRARGRFPTGVAFVTASVGGRPEGLIVSSFTAVSAEPPLVAFCPARSSLTWRRMRGTGRFGVHVLSRSDEAFARCAAQPGADRFGRLPFDLTDSGVPHVRGALAFLECAIEAEHPAGDHTIVVGRVNAAAADGDDDPLVVWRGRWGSVVLARDVRIGHPDDDAAVGAPYG